MAPIDYGHGRGTGATSKVFAEYCQAMQRVDAARVRSKSEADALLTPSVPDLAVRQFLLTNLKKSDNSILSFRINLPILEAALKNLWAFSAASSKPSSIETLFIAGSRADYIRQQYIPVIHSLFPRAQVKALDAGHWWDSFCSCRGCLLLNTDIQGPCRFDMYMTGAGASLRLF